MAEPTGATTSEDGGRTYLDPGVRKSYRSVTTILGMINKPAIAPWKAKMAGIRAVEEFEEFQRKLQEAKTKKAKEDVRLWISRAADDYMNAAGVKGTKVHNIAEAIIKDEDPGPISEEIQPYVDGYLKFYQDHKPEYLFTETTFINRTLEYAGTADFGATLWSTFGVPIIGDWKSGATGPYLEWGYQLAAYAFAEHTLTKEPETGKLVVGPMPEISHEKAAVVRLLPNRYELHWLGAPPLTLPVLFQGFKAAITLQRLADASKSHGAFTKG